MENILRYYLMPHPPLIIPEVGRGQEKVIQKTIDACNKIGEEIGELKPETVVIITPHGTMFSDALAISNEEYIKGNFTQFRDFETYIEGSIDKEFNEKLIDICNEKNIPVLGVDSKILKKFNREYELDHGAMIPMYFINKFYKDYKIVHVTYAKLNDIELYKFGMAIKESAKELNKKIVFIASGDLSHKLKEDGPYEYSPEGAKFDKALLDNLEKGDVLSIFNMDKYMVKCAGECGLRSVFIMLGAMEGEEAKGKLLSYEGPFGVGYGVMSFNNEEKGDVKLESLINMKKEILNKKISNANPYVKIARESLNHYYSSGDELLDLDISVDVLERPHKATKEELDPKKYGVIAIQGHKKGLLLPDLEGVDTVEQQLQIACEKAGISLDEEYDIERFKVTRYKEGE